MLAIDIGNTNISFCVFRGNRVVKRFDIPTRQSAAAIRRSVAQALKPLPRQYPKVAQVVICSVVPAALKAVEAAAQQCYQVKPLVIGRDIIVPLRNKYRNPKQVGQDRLVCAYAVKEIYGAPAIIIDLGTAITFDVVSAKGHYEGGMIVPGIQMSAESLFTKTALLPKIKAIRGPQALVGRDTQTSILSGIFYGYGTMCSGLIDMIAKQVKGKPKVVVTGGHTDIMRKFIAHKITGIDRDLVFRGLKLLAEALRK